MEVDKPLPEGNCTCDSSNYPHVVGVPLNVEGTITTNLASGTGWYTCTPGQFVTATPVKPDFNLKLKYGCFSLGKYELERLAKALELSLQTQTPFQVMFMGQLLQTEQLLDLLQHLKANKNKSLSELLDIDLHQIIADCEEVIDKY